MESVISEIETNCADVPDEFDFPFTPYPIQHEFMSKLYEVIEKKQFGIFESPTGTVSMMAFVLFCFVSQVRNVGYCIICLFAFYFV